MAPRKDHLCHARSIICMRINIAGLCSVSTSVDPSKSPLLYSQCDQAQPCCAQGLITAPAWRPQHRIPTAQSICKRCARFLSSSGSWRRTKQNQNQAPCLRDRGIGHPMHKHICEHADAKLGSCSCGTERSVMYRARTPCMWHLWPRSLQVCCMCMRANKSRHVIFL